MREQTSRLVPVGGALQSFVAHRAFTYLSRCLSGRYLVHGQKLLWELEERIQVFVGCLVGFPISGQSSRGKIVIDQRSSFRSCGRRVLWGRYVFKNELSGLHLFHLLLWIEGHVASRPCVLRGLVPRDDLLLLHVGLALGFKQPSTLWEPALVSIGLGGIIPVIWVDLHDRGLLTIDLYKVWNLFPPSDVRRPNCDKLLSRLTRRDASCSRSVVRELVTTCGLVKLGHTW